MRLWWKGIVSKEDVRGKGGRGVAQMEADVILGVARMGAKEMCGLFRMGYGALKVPRKRVWLVIVD